MDKSKKYRLIKDFPTRHIGDTIYYNYQIGNWFWDKGGAIPEDLLRDLEGFPKIDEWFEEVEELCVPIGTKFTFRGRDTIYTVEKVGDYLVKINWQLNSFHMFISINQMNRNFKNGTYIEYKEPEYEILSFGRTGIEGAEWELKNGKYYNDGGASWTLKNMIYSKNEVCVKSGELYIHSIKRLSDGEVFTIGDKVEYKSSGEWRKHSISNIIKFEIRFDNKLLISTDGKKIWTNLSDDIRKVKSLFTTEDGVDIFEGDFVYVIPFNRIEYIRQSAFKNEWGSNKSSYYKVFSTEKAAKNYIKLHKPVLSYNEILTMFDEWDNSSLNRDGFKDKLTNLVKNKIKW